MLAEPRLRFGEFLHHLGLDSLSRTGIPNFLLPSAVSERLMRTGLQLGLSQSLLADLLTVNVPKILGGGTCLVMAGQDVVAAFSDTIPHTFSQAGRPFAAGILERACTGSRLPWRHRPPRSFPSMVFPWEDSRMDA